MEGVHAKTPRRDFLDSMPWPAVDLRKAREDRKGRKGLFHQAGMNKKDTKVLKITKSGCIASSPWLFLFVNKD
jgi:hypothetical protein